MSFLDPRLIQAAALFKETIPIPTIINTIDAPGPTRIREFESLDAIVNYSARYVRQLHADFPGSGLGALQRSRAATMAWFDEPAYAFDVAPPTVQQPKFSPLRSSNAQIKARVDQRIQDAGDRVLHHSNPEWELRSYLGFQGPVTVPKDSHVFTLDDVRRFTRSDELFDRGLTGKNVKVAVIDTGVDATHPMLDGQVLEQVDVTGEGPIDGVGHGTHCASEIAGKPIEYHGKVAKLDGKMMQGIVPDARLIAIKVLTSEGTGLASYVIRGIEEAIARDADILSMSLGSMFGGRGDAPDAQAVDAASQLGKICSVAVGNSFSYLTAGSPATARGAVSVGSVAMRNPRPGAVSTFSSKGPSIDGRILPSICAPGGQLGPGLNETILGATTGTMAIESAEQFSLLRGSSMATPFVSGILAQVLRSGLPKDRDQLEAVLSNGVSQTMVPIKNNRTGWGVIDAVRLYEALGTSGRPRLGIVRRSVGSRQRPVLGALAGLWSKSVPGSKTEPDILRIPLV